MRHLRPLVTLILLCLWAGAASAQEATDGQPAGAQQPAAAQPATGPQQPVAPAQPETAQQPTAEQPAAGAQQPAAAQPAMGAQQPVAPTQPETAQQPAAEQPAAGAQQPAAAQPAMGPQQPVAPAQPETAQQPAAEQPAAGAQPSTATAFGRPRFMVYLFQAEQDTLSPTERFVLYNSILAAATQANPDVVLLESPDQTVPDTSQGREELARRINADCWLFVSASGGFANLTIEAETYDILRQQTFGQEIIRPGFAVDYRTISTGFWDKIVEAIRTSYTRIVDATTFTVKGVPGTELTGVPGGPYRIDKSGTLVQKIPYPSSFTMKARAGGYYDQEQSLFLGIEPLTVNLNQVAKPRLGAEVWLSSFQFPGIRLWWYVIPAEVFVRLSATTELFGFYPIDNAPSVVAVGSPLSQVGLDAGLYIFPAESLLRFYIGVGGYLRFSSPPAPSFSIDTQGAPGAITLSLGAEYSPSRRLRFVIDYQPAFILASNPQQFINLSFVPNSFPSGQVPGYIILPWGLFDLRNVYLGLRMDF